MAAAMFASVVADAVPAATADAVTDAPEGVTAGVTSALVAVADAVAAATADAVTGVTEGVSAGVTSVLVEQKGLRADVGDALRLLEALLSVGRCSTCRFVGAVGANGSEELRRPSRRRLGAYMCSSRVDPACTLPEAALHSLWIWMITASWSSYCWVASLLSESPAAGISLQFNFWVSGSVENLRSSTSRSGIFRFPEVS